MTDTATNGQPMPDPYEEASAAIARSYRQSRFLDVPEEFWEVKGWSKNGNFYTVSIDREDRQRIFDALYEQALTPPRCEMKIYTGFSTDQVIEFGCGQTATAFINRHWVCSDHRSIKGLTA